MGKQKDKSIDEEIINKLNLSEPYPTRTFHDFTRSELATKLLKYSSIIIGMTLIGILVLIGFKKLEADKAITLILAVSSIFSGLLGSAITYYFSSNK
ncbi:hypothetical protein HYX04_02270 [Candidatus Woesearchaeota archaeon]|nr:hypothetical protein [Candidatus Woesearchaeota archaeon]